MLSMKTLQTEQLTLLFQCLIKRPLILEKELIVQAFYLSTAHLTTTNTAKELLETRAAKQPSEMDRVWLQIEREGLEAFFVMRMAHLNLMPSLLRKIFLLRKSLSS